MNASPHHKVKVWDWSIRVFHWSLPVLLFLLWRSATEDLEWHMVFAQVLLGLLIYRIVWGFIGTPYARFSHFIYNPKRIFSYFVASARPNKPVYLSHNPVGGIMVLVILATLLFQATTGLFASDDIFYNGPLYKYVSGATTDLLSSWHRNWFYQGILIIVGLHILAIVAYRLRGEPLVKAMVTGSKEVPSQRVVDKISHNEHFPWARFIVTVAIAGAVVWLIFYYL
ncbi:MAG: cytochrome B [Aeromonadales bacterium]|nr:cytochrome B [Aeromonadales bacterium]